MSSKRTGKPRDLVAIRREDARRVAARNVAGVQAPILKAHLDRQRATSKPQEHGERARRFAQGSNTNSKFTPAPGSVDDLSTELSTALNLGLGAHPGKHRIPVPGLQPLLTGEGFAKGSSPQSRGDRRNLEGRGRKGGPETHYERMLAQIRGTPITGPAGAGNQFGGRASLLNTRRVASRSTDPLSRVGTRGANRGRTGRPDQITSPILGGAFGVGSSTVLGNT